MAGSFIKVLIKGITEFPTVEGNFECSNFKELCNTDNSSGIIMRKWCPHTCGCNSPKSGLILSRDDMGCPNSCHNHDLYHVQLEDVPCDDQFVNSTGFQRYLKGLTTLRDSYNSKEWQKHMTGWIDKLSSKGCAAHKLPGFWGDLCHETVFTLKPLQFLCPHTCRCVSPWTVAPFRQPRTLR